MNNGMFRSQRYSQANSILGALSSLGNDTIIETVRIEWRSGIRQELHGVSVKQHLTVTEPARLQVSWLGALRVQSWKGDGLRGAGVRRSGPVARQCYPVTTVINLAGTLEFTDPRRGTISGDSTERCFGNLGPRPPSLASWTAVTESAKSPLWLWQRSRPRSSPPTLAPRPKAATPKTPSPQSKTLARQLAPHSVHGPNARSNTRLIN